MLLVYSVVVSTINYFRCRWGATGADERRAKGYRDFRYAVPLRRQSGQFWQLRVIWTAVSNLLERSGGFLRIWPFTRNSSYVLYYSGNEIPPHSFFNLSSTSIQGTTRGGYTYSWLNMLFKPRKVPSSQEAGRMSICNISTSRDHTIAVSCLTSLHIAIVGLGLKSAISKLKTSKNQELLVRQ